MNITMHRFFVPRDSFAGDNISITGQLVYQITRVLRLKPGDHIIVLDNNGWEFETEIESIKRDIVQGKIINRELGKG